MYQQPYPGQGYPGQHPGQQPGYGGQPGYPPQGGHPGHHHGGHHGHPGQGPPGQGPPPQQGGQGNDGPIWLFEVRTGVWQPVTPLDNKVIEEAYQTQQGAQPVVTLFGGGKEAVQYKLNFQTMQRINVNTNSTRTMKRAFPQELQNMPQDSIIPPPQMAVQGDIKVQWLFMEGEQTVPLQQSDSDAVEAVYSANKGGQGVVNIQGAEYHLNFSNFTRTSAHAPQPQGIARVLPTEFPPFQPVPKGTSWYFQDDNKCWMQFAPEDAEVVEKQYQSGQGGVVSLRGIQYELDFKNWVRVNLQSKSSRTIRRHQA